MKFNTVQEFPLKDELRRINISARGLSSVAGVNNSFLNLVMSGKRTGSPRFAQKIFNALEKIKNDPQLQEKLRAITRTSNKSGGKTNLTQRQEIILKRRTGQDLLSIGKQYGVSRETIRQITKNDIECQKFSYNKK